MDAYEGKELRPATQWEPTVHVPDATVEGLKEHGLLRSAGKGSRTPAGWRKTRSGRVISPSGAKTTAGRRPLSLVVEEDG
jgi:hypothetical protein